MKPGLDTALVLDAWTELAPDPHFADRVLAAYDAPIRARSRWPFVACAVAVALLFAPLLVSRTPPSGSTALASGPDLDLGLQTD